MPRSLATLYRYQLKNQKLVFKHRLVLISEGQRHWRITRFKSQVTPLHDPVCSPASPLPSLPGQCAHPREDGLKMPKSASVTAGLTWKMNRDTRPIAQKLGKRPHPLWEGFGGEKRRKEEGSLPTPTWEGCIFHRSESHISLALGISTFCGLLGSLG